MKERKAKVSDAELEVMRVLWDAGEPLPVSRLRVDVAARTGWESSTIKTLLQRLCDKGAVVQEKKNVYYYSPSIGRDEYAGIAARSIADKLYSGGAKELVAALVADGLSKEEIAELRAMLEET